MSDPADAGKTTILDYIYLILATRGQSAGEPFLRGYDGTSSAAEQIGTRLGVVYVDLEPAYEFDRDVLSSFPHWEPVEQGALRFGPLPPRQICYACTDSRAELWFTDVREFYEGIYQEILDSPAIDPPDYKLDEQQRRGDGPIPRPLLLGWDVDEIDAWVVAALAEVARQRGYWVDDAPLEENWLEWVVSESDESLTSRVRPEMWQ